MNKKYLAVLGVLIVALLAVLLIYNQGQRADNSPQSTDKPTEEQVAEEEALSLYGLTEEKREVIFTYLSSNISSLSPEGPVLGGSWYVTELNFPDFNRADVRYEDGHIARRAIVSFAFSENGDPIINDFLIIPEEDPVFNDDNQSDSADISVPVETGDINVLPSADLLEASIPLETEPVFCTMDVMMCPDGSSVGRIAPNCDFAPCSN